jgi:hypothetical protein
MEGDFHELPTLLAQIAIEKRRLGSDKFRRQYAAILSGG